MKEKTIHALSLFCAISFIVWIFCVTVKLFVIDKTELDKTEEDMIPTAECLLRMEIVGMRTARLMNQIR